MKKLDLLFTVLFVFGVAFSFTGCKCGSEKDAAQIQMIEQVTAQLTAELGLSEDQTVKVKALNEEYLPQFCCMLMHKCEKPTPKDCCRANSSKCDSTCCNGVDSCKIVSCGDSAECDKPCCKDSAKCEKACKAEKAAPCESSCESEAKKCKLTKEEMEQKKAEAKAAMEKYVAKLKEILTSEQAEKFTPCMLKPKKSCEKACKEGENAPCEKTCKQ